MLKTVQYDPADSLNLMEASLLRGITDFYQDPALAEQVQHCRVTQRAYSGCGFFTTLTVPVGSRQVVAGKARTYNGGDLDAPQLSHGAGSVLFLRAGIIDFLEVFAYADGDPATVDTFTLQPVEPTTGGNQFLF